MDLSKKEIREQILQILYDKYWETRFSGYTFKKLQTRLDLNKRILRGNIKYLENKDLIYLPETGFLYWTRYYIITENGIDYIEDKKNGRLLTHQKENNTKTLFICFSHEDDDFVKKLEVDLSKFGANTWIDYKEITVGDSLIEVISDAIKKTSHFAVVLSPDSIESNWVQNELEMAIRLGIEGKKIKVLPLLSVLRNVDRFLLFSLLFISTL